MATISNEYEAAQYVGRIRNAAKRQYGIEWLAYCLDPTTPMPKATGRGLSFMGAQAVRHRIADLLSRPIGDLPRQEV